MATLTDALTLQLRGEIGDTGKTFVIGHTELQAMYDRADGDYDLTLVYALRRMRAHYARMLASCEADQRKAYNTLFDEYDRMTKEAEKEAGVSMGRLNTADITLNLNDEDAPL